MTIPPTDPLRLERALAAIDAVHAQDPRHTQDETGQPVPYELLYARRLSDTLAEFAPEASETLQLALRAQHLERWSIPRESYPMDRSGYLNWRSDLNVITSYSIHYTKLYDDIHLTMVQQANSRIEWTTA